MQCTPYAVFHGRVGSLKMGPATLTTQQEFMEEDFLFYDDNEGEYDLCFDPAVACSTSHIVPPESHCPTEQAALAVVARKQLQQAKQKHVVFEATEVTICRNKRAHIKKMKPTHYKPGQCVLFKNPQNHGLVTSLNVRGQVTEKVGTDLYKVKHGDNYIVLFGCQMVPQAMVMGDEENAKARGERLVECSFNSDRILDNICAHIIAVEIG